jgi:hypothetical protein
MAARLTSADIVEAATGLGVERCTIVAIVEAESGGVGFNADGSIKIQFEGHVFYRELKKRRIDPSGYQAGNEDIIYPAFTMRYVLGQKAEYRQLHKALAIHEEAALLSTSWGLFQIMGFNHAHCGYDNVHDFVQAQKESEAKQLASFCAYIKSTKYLRYLAVKDWSGFAERYNGPANVAVYSQKIKKAFDRCKTTS